MTEKIEIPLSKNKLLLGIGLSVVFIIIGIWLFIYANNFQDHSIRLARNPMLVKLVGLIGVFFFGATGIFGFKKLSDKRVGVTIDKDGITDHTNGGSIGLIKWKDISKIRTQQVMSTKFLLIDVKNPEAYIEKAESAMKAKVMRTNMQVYKTPLSMTSSTLKCSFDELEGLVRTSMKKHK